MRFFNTSGPVNPAQHYALPPLNRLDRDEIHRLIRQDRYFVLHAPRQTGKTTALLALMAELKDAGQYRCCYVNVETVQTAREDVFRSVRAILSRLAESAWIYLQDGWLREHARTNLREVGAEDALATVLGRWAIPSARGSFRLRWCSAGCGTCAITVSTPAGNSRRSRGERVQHQGQGQITAPG